MRVMLYFLFDHVYSYTALQYLHIRHIEFHMNAIIKNKTLTYKKRRKCPRKLKTSLENCKNSNK